MKKLIPIYDESAPIACTIDDSEVPERIELLERMRAKLRRLDRTEHGLLLRFPQSDGIEADLRRFAVDEKRCCAFWGFDVEVGDGEARLRWDAPPSAAGLLDRLRAYFEGDEPVTSLRGLL